MSTQEHIRRIQIDGDEAAFSGLYELHEPRLNKFAYSFLGDREVAQEIVNDAFLKIWMGRESLYKIRNLQVYLYVLIKNACLNHLRNTSSQKIKELQLTETYYFQLSVDPSHLLISKELEVRVLNAVNLLPPRCKLIFKMVKEDDLSCNEVAAILGLSNKTVFAQLAIALKKLDDALTGK
ncbi:RNA polymerase sigma factor [Mucilaginibacter lappiensis]|uniref:RNA polymerase sigma-70 factor (ECF subfamily) n=1 Tax=Mucilaginibacter lappiensis TaxID=354630 RepID=A0A1N6NL62_9SPHI|nr:RNA polymerase sigma-70 factor [Mucilaginibacter lappiensis]MBB6107911.1 RNA polymerase sigma-70 factor (ECF subfamily) [Mucilaginibacter lappiensis]MBB6126019.1 RNA polymerase sigma-70 factor (ECF subfamily) [Mucilaginibacter lappiensis]SIP92835.1 RNA polymerase sigma-70 factor, ECF subfamily [Mucilaginibacter lappiensis]